MIISTMNSKEKAAQAPKTFEFLYVRTKSFLERNMKIFKKTKKDKLVFEKSFRSNEFGEWDVEIEVFMDRQNKGFRFEYTGYQKYFVSRAKNEGNNGIGFYIIGTVRENCIFDVPPHAINRFKERFYEEDDVPEIKQVRHDIYDQLCICRLEYKNYVPENAEEEEVVMRYLGNEPDNYAFIAHTLEGQFLGNCYIKDINDKTSERYMCLTTYMDNEGLKNEQLAHTVAINEVPDAEERTKTGTDAKKIIRRLKRQGNGREELIDEKKSSIETSIIENEKKKVVDLIMEVKKNKILRGFGNLAESGLKKIGLK